MAFLITFILALFIASSEGTLSYRSDGPNVEYKSLLRNLELTPYVLHDGSWYRDMLTIEASKAVGQYARKYDYQPYEYYEKKVRTQCSVLKITKKSHLELRAKRATCVCILRGQKLNKNAKNSNVTF